MMSSNSYNFYRFRVCVDIFLWGYGNKIENAGSTIIKLSLTSTLTHQKFMSLETKVHILFVVRGVFLKDLELCLFA